MTPNKYNGFLLPIVFVLFFSTGNCFAQLTVTAGQTAMDLAQTLAGPGITVSNATLTGAPDAAGIFNGANSNIGMPSGVILCTGPITIAPGPNNSGSAGQDNGQPGNAQLNGLAGANTFNAVVLEFDFVPLSNTAEFNYVFGSEEYPEFVNSGFNDAFAFFISGPGIPGTQNMALIPNTATPVTIDNLNAGTNNQYYVNNNGGASVQYDAFTTVLTATANVQACETYHLEIMIADAGDGVWDSGVFLEEGSLTSAVVEITASTATADSTAYENCSNATVTFTLSETLTTDYTINYSIGGTATNGTDFPAIPTSVTIPANTLSTSFQVEPVYDGVPEGIETLIIDVQTSVCGSDSIIIYINDVSTVTVEAFGDTAFCGGTAMLWAQAQGGAGTYTYNWSNGMTGDTIFVNPAATTTYTVTSNDFCASTVPTPTDDVTVTIDPTPTANAGPDLNYCAGDAVTLIGADGINYQWFDLTNNQVVGNTASISLNPVGDVDYRMITMNGACSDTDFVSITELPASPAAADGDTAFCPGGTAQLDVLNVVNATFDWSPPASLDDPTSQNPLASPQTTTTYEVVITNASGCVKTDSVVVEVYPIPDVTFSVDEVCLNEPSVFTDLSSIASGNISSLNWNFGDGNSSSGINVNNTYQTEGNYTIQLVAISDQGCKDSISQTTTIHPLPKASFTFNNDCADKDILFNDASTVTSGSVVLWNWNFGNGQSSTLQTPAPQNYSNSGFYLVNLEVASDFGCLDDTTQTIEIYPIPIANFTFDSVCFGNPISFNNLSIANGIYPISSTVYAFSDGQTSNESDPQIIFGQHGFYDATLTVTTDVGCSDQISLGNAVVHPLPVSQFDPGIKNCLNDTTWFTDESSVPFLLNDAIIGWNWNFDDGTASSEQNPFNVYGVHGWYNVSLATETDKGCSDTVQHQVEIYPLPEVSFTSDRTSGCQPFRVLFEENVTIPEPYSIAQYAWNLGDGDGTVNTQNPINVYNNDTINELSFSQYTVSLQASSSNGCVSADTVENYITEYPKPDALFAAKPWITDVLNTEIAFEDLSSQNVTEWYWDFGDGSDAFEQHPTNRFPENVGLYEVTQLVTTEFGCKDTISAEVEIQPIFTFYIPNAFTPDADGVNEEFFGDGEGFTSYTMTIYNRWGEQIFYSNDPDKKWDGTYMGKQVEQGVYIYYFYVLDWNNNDHEYRGHVTLMR